MCVKRTEEVFLLARVEFQEGTWTRKVQKKKIALHFATLTLNKLGNTCIALQIWNIRPVINSSRNFSS